MEEMLVGAFTKLGSGSAGMFGAIVAYLIWAAARREKAASEFCEKLDAKHEALHRVRHDLDRQRIETDRLLAANIAANTEIIRAKG